MSSYESDIDDDLDFEDAAGNAMQQLRKANKAKEKELSELRSELAKMRNEQRERTIKEVFASRGVNSKIAAFVPKDIEVDETSLSTWLDEYGDVFGINQEKTEQPTVPDGYTENYNRAQQTVSAAMTADSERQVLSQMEEAAAKGPEALKQFFADMAKRGL